MKLNLTPEQISLIKSPTSGKVTMKDGREFYYVPYWFTQNPDGTMERLNFDQLPDDVQEHMSTIRNFVKNVFL